MYSCYKLEDPRPSYDDGHSTVVHDLPGDTLATDGWDDNYATGDLYLRQRYYTASWTDSIRFVPRGNEIINAAVGVDGNSEANIKWLANAASHPVTVTNNDAYLNTADGYRYIYRSNAWYQMGIDGNRGIAANDSIFVNWRGYITTPPVNPQQGWAYRDNDNNRVYRYNGKAWELMVNDANYNQNNNFVQIEYSKSGKAAGRYSMFLFRFRDGWQQFIRDAADSARYLKTVDWDIAFTGELNSTIWLNNGRAKTGPGTGSPVTRSSLIMYEYGYEFMNEAPEDLFFDNRPADFLQIGYSSEFGPGVNPWYELGSTFIAKPLPYRAFYLRLETIDANTGQHSYKYGKLQLISMYKGAPEVLTDRNWPSPYLTFRYFIQQDGSRNLKTKD
ncbi:hypothetical protein GCM10023149_23450 [Mucilaginibacter gynuensis]|uniref:DUF5005 domain-containing protein n=2 Tax=Mucilaginibacter gynuensis TaxID=1302236 RepID=A0ABP8GEG6_9SPHI